MAAILFASQLVGLTAAHAARPPRLQYTEPLLARWEIAEARRTVQFNGGGSAALRFDAFGRRFALALRHNDGLAPSTPDYELLEGGLDATPGSWARITRRGRSVTGIVFDGQEYFGIEPVEDVLPFLDPDVPVPDGDNVVYRLSDLLLDPEALACGLGGTDGPVTAAAAMDALSAELSTPEVAAAIGPTRRVQLAPVADIEFVSQYGSNAAVEILARLNIVEGIFTAQVGVDIEAEPAKLFNAATSDYTLTSRTAETLLGQISDYRLATDEQAGIMHLFTGKVLNNNLVGIAWQGGVCLAREGAGLSAGAGQTQMLSALIAAHELGHNFGAPHDGDASKPCASTPTTFLMSATVNGSSTFSDCSLAQMATTIGSRAASYPSCLVRLYDFDAGVTAPANRSIEIDTDLDIPITVQNLGTQALTNVQWQLLTSPAGLDVVSVTTPAGACPTTTGRADCSIAELDAESTWEATVRVRSDQPRSYSVTTSIAVAGDERSSNDSDQLSVTVTDPNASSGGGGGSLDALTALGLLLAGAVRPRRRHPGRESHRAAPHDAKLCDDR